MTEIPITFFVILIVCFFVHALSAMPITLNILFVSTLAFCYLTIEQKTGDKYPSELIQMTIAKSDVVLESGLVVPMCTIKWQNSVLVLIGRHSEVTVNGKTYTSADCQAAAQKPDPSFAALIEGAQAPYSSEAN
jgi:hypothetical protein